MSSFQIIANDGNHYGQRLRAYFVPPVKGNYTFYATCDSECALYLSFNEQPGNKEEIIHLDQNHRTGYDQWDRYLQQRSCPQELEQGKFYYIEALHCNFIDDDHMRIHIKFPGSRFARPLDKEFLFLYQPGSSARATCIVLRGCGVTCGGGMHTHIRVNNGSMCGAEHERVYHEPLSLHIEARDVTSSSAVVTWTSLGGNAGSIDVSGYRVSIGSTGEEARVKTVDTSLNSLLFEGLRSFTNYCVTVKPVTILKVNRMDECHSITTEDDVPDAPPQNVSTTSQDATSILVKWRPIPPRNQNGVILGYKLTYKFISATRQLARPTEDQTNKWPRYSFVLGAEVFLVGLRDVRPFTWYCLQMLGFTRKGEGNESTCVFILTGQTVPSLPPEKVTTTALGNTAFSVAWQPVPLDHVHGIVLGYKLFYAMLDVASSVSSKTVNSSQTLVEIRGLQASSRLCVTVLAFTSAGDGPNSSCVEAWTWSEEILFPQLEAGSYGSPTGIVVTWDAPPDHVLSQLTHYHVTYEPISEAGTPLVNTSSRERNVSVDSRLVSIQDLSTYTTYKIHVAPIALNSELEEKRVLIAETCRCPHLLLANWMSSPPYVIADSSGKPRGLIPQILARMLQESCGTCFNYKTWNISYTVNSTKSVTEPDTLVNVDFRFPVRSAIGRTKYRGEHTYIPMISVPGVAVMTRTKTPSAYARDLGSSVLGCWPIFAISFVMAIITGILVWFAESGTNSEQFFAYQFHQGIVEGIWWSLVTMTTVGYGDRYPKTIIGKSIAVVWFLTGIVMSSLLISSLTSSLSVRMLDDKLNLARGKKVAALAHFPEYDLLIRLMSKAGGSNTYPSLERLVGALKFGDVDGILVDVYTAHFRDDLFNSSWIRITQIIPFEFTTGVVISGNAAKLEREFRDFFGNKSTEVTDILQETNEKRGKVSTGRTLEMPILDPSTPVYHITTFLMLALLCLAIMMGLVYHAWYKKKLKWRYELQSLRAKEMQAYLKTKSELRDMVEEFHQRFASIYKQMRAKHIKQLERLKRTAVMNGTTPPKQQKGDWV